MKAHPVGRVLTRRKDTGFGDLPLLSMSAQYGVRPRSEDGGRAASEDLSAYLRVLPGDLVVNKLSARDGGYGLSELRGLVSPAYWVLRPIRDVEPRYLNYQLHAAPVRAEIGRLSKFMPPAQFDIAWEDFAALEICLPPVEEQRRVADFLDDQIACLNELVVLRGLQSDQLRFRLQAWIDSTIDQLVRTEGVAQLRRYVASIDQGWSPECSNLPAEGANPGVLKLSAVRFGRFRSHENKAMLPGVSPKSQYRIAAGDLLITRANTPELVGDVAYVADDHPNLYLSDLIYRVRVRNVLPQFVSLALRSSRTRGVLRVTGRGTSQSMAKIRGDDIRELLVPKADKVTQDSIIAGASEYEQDLARIGEWVARSSSEFEERKRSLITAAVTGQMDVSTAKPVGVGNWVPNIGANIDTHAKTAATAAARVGGI